MNTKIYRKLLFVAAISLGATGCSKYLEKKPDKHLVIPSTLKDLQALLDNNSKINRYMNNGIGEASADNYYMTYEGWSGLYFQSRKDVYIWGKEIFYDDPSNDWLNIYQVVNYANTVLENVKKIPVNHQNETDWDNVKGSALFLRATSFHKIATNFSKAYDKNTASTDLGIPLRLGSDFNEVSVRSSVQQTYDQIIQDLRASIPLLPVAPAFPTRPSRPAAYALLSRVYLSMGEYHDARSYADSCLQLYNVLMDYNTLNPSLTSPIPKFNDEIIYYTVGAPAQTRPGRGKIDSVLYDSYKSDDLRKSIFFNSDGDGTFSFKGSYDASLSSLFFGIATDEVYLTKAECLARGGKIDEAMNTLNRLLVKRWKKGTFVPFATSDTDSALEIILTERRKELLMRDLRWMDIKRLNKEGANIGLKRILNGQTYELIPNSPKFALPFPDYVIDISGMTQNPR